MPPETEHAIEKGNVYEDTEGDRFNYIKVKDFYVDESGRTQIKISRYTEKPIAAYNSAGHLTGVNGHVTLEVNDVRDRILKGELIFDGK